MFALRNLVTTAHPARIPEELLGPSLRVPEFRSPQRRSSGRGVETAPAFAAGAATTFASAFAAAFGEAFGEDFGGALGAGFEEDLEEITACFSFASFLVTAKIRGKSSFIRTTRKQETFRKKPSPGECCSVATATRLPPDLTSPQPLW